MLVRAVDAGVFRHIPLEGRGKLFVSPMPSGAYDRRARLLKVYRRYRVQHVIMLVTDEELAKKARVDLCRRYARLGVSYSRHPMKDLQSPTVDEIRALVADAAERLGDSGQRVAVHCHAGVGRTAVAAACIVHRLDQLSADEAIGHVRRHTEVKLTSEQVGLIRTFAAHLS